MYLHFMVKSDIIYRKVEIQEERRKSMKIIGVCGGSGAGKSTVSNRLVDVLPNTLFIDVDKFFSVFGSIQ